MWLEMSVQPKAVVNQDSKQLAAAQCRRDKARENEAAMQVLADLLAELDNMPEQDRLLALIQGVLAGNIFDWGAQACVDLYHAGTILEIYQKARNDIAHRPWRIDHFDAFAAALTAPSNSTAETRMGAPLESLLARMNALSSCATSYGLHPHTVSDLCQPMFAGMHGAWTLFQAAPAWV